MTTEMNRQMNYKRRGRKRQTKKKGEGEGEGRDGRCRMWWRWFGTVCLLLGFGRYSLDWAIIVGVLNKKKRMRKGKKKKKKKKKKKIPSLSVQIVPFPAPTHPLPSKDKISSFATSFERSFIISKITPLPPEL